MTQQVDQSAAPRAPRSREPQRALFIVIVAVVALLATVYVGTSLYLAAQVTQVERTTSADTPALVGLAFEAVNFQSRDATVDLKGWYIPVDAHRGAIIMVHGIDSFKGREGFLPLARRLHDAGYSVLLFDLRGHGESGTGKLGAGLFEQQDVLGAFDYVLARGVPAERVGILGSSYGAAITALAAAREPRIRALVLDSGFADVRDLVATEVRKRTNAPGPVVAVVMPGMITTARLRYGIDLGQVVPEHAIAGLPYPILIIHCRADDRIPVAHAIRNKAASTNAATELWLVDGAAHARAFTAHPEEYTRRILSYFDSVLPPLSQASLRVSMS